jgi:hypothetical protein
MDLNAGECRANDAHPHDGNGHVAIALITALLSCI